jgi:predicted permease
MLDDLRFALRRLASAPLFALAAIATLALGIGANTAIFSIADAVLFRPLPYADADRLLLLQMRERDTGARTTLVDYTSLKAIDEHHRGLSKVGLLEVAERLVFTVAGNSTYVPVVRVTANYFDLLGARAARGRLLTAADEGAAGRPAILSYDLWQTHFGGSDTIVGRPLAIGGTTFDIVGILPRDFVFPTFFARPSSVIALMPPLAQKAEGGTFHPIVRLEPGVSVAQAQDEIDALIQPLAAATSTRIYLPTLEDVRAVLYPVGRPIMAMLFAAASLVLLLGCANLSNMLLARARRNERDAGVRIALGATRARLVRTVVLEALLIGTIGSALAVVVTYLSFDLLLRQVPPVAYGRAPVGVDLRVLTFGAGLGVIAALVAAAVPAWTSARMDALHLVQQRDTSRARSFGRPMIVVQVAMAVLLVFGAAVAARALLSVLRVPLGFSPDRVVMIGSVPPLRGAALHDHYLRLFDTLSRRPDVVAVGAASSLPLSSVAPDQAVDVNGARHKSLAIYHVLPGYFEALAIPLRRGRMPDMNDARNGALVAVLSESAARVLFADRDPIGGTVSTPSGGTFNVIGVVADVRRTLDREATHPVYALPHSAIRAMTVVIRTRSIGPATLADLKREVAAMTPNTPVNAMWWSDSIASLTAYRNPRFQTLVLGSFAALALVLTATGILAVVSFVTASRARELGIRIAIGATPSSLVALMLRQTLMPVGLGLIVGLVATRWAGRLAEAQLFDITVHDPATLAAASAVVLATAVLAAYVPARRAGSVDPIATLRAE